MAELFCEPLDSLTLEDIKGFLCIECPENSKPREGVQLDFKEDLPQDIGDTVAAMANTYGGLIFIGVKSSKEKQNVPIGLPGAALGSDGKARITDKIVSSVRPRPQFEVQVWTADAPDKQIAAIRVREGELPPYEYSQGATVRIPVRVQDSNRQATLMNIEALLRKRSLHARPVEETARQYLESGDLYCTIDGQRGEIRDEEFQKLVAVPRAVLRLRLDAASERHFDQLKSAAFPREETGSGPPQRTGLFYQTELRGTTSSGHIRHRIWREWSDGALGFVSGLRIGHQNDQPLGDLVEDALRFCRLAHSIFHQHGYYGGVILGHRLSCPSAKITPKFPPPAGLGDYDTVPGIRIPDSRAAALPAWSDWIEQTECQTLNSPEELIAEMFLRQLRATLGAHIDFDKLLEAIQALSVQIRPARGA